jgi:hypothetical protein
MFDATLVLGFVFIYTIALVVFHCLPDANGSNRFPTIRVGLTPSKFSPDLPHSGRHE